MLHVHNGNYSTILCLHADPLHSCHMQLRMTQLQLYIVCSEYPPKWLQCCLLVTWLVPRETATVSAQVLYTSYNHAQIYTLIQCHFIRSHIIRMHAWLAVTCHQHFWQKDRDLLRATGGRTITKGKVIINLLTQTSQSWTKTQSTQTVLSALNRRWLRHAPIDHQCQILDAIASDVCYRNEFTQAAGGRTYGTCVPILTLIGSFI